MSRDIEFISSEEQQGESGGEEFVAEDYEFDIETISVEVNSPALSSMSVCLCGDVTVKMACVHSLEDIQMRVHSVLCHCR